VARRGWGGNPPTDDEEARQRITDAAVDCIDRFGPTKTGLSDVAAAIGVTRQTVYRHFSSTEALFEAVAQAGVEAYLDELAAHLDGIEQPAELVVEAIAYCTERLPKERHLGLLLSAGRTELFWRGVTSPMAREFGRAMLTRTNIDWGGYGFSRADLDGLVEFALRLLASLVTEPNPAHARGPELRAFLRRWLAPALDVPPGRKVLR
jgi:AcrR family transcriptional regulator